jgi:methionine-rich copper-binding protein CopC
MRTTAPAVLRTAAVTGLLLAVVGLSAGPAAAHAQLVRIIPGEGATVTTSPSRVELRFDEAVLQPSSVVVIDSRGQRVSTGATTVKRSDAVVRVDITKPGSYTVAYRVLSDDGHPVTGESTFRFQPGGKADPGSAASGSTNHQGHSSAEHASLSDSSGSRPGLMVAGVAALALLAGLGLLATIRRNAARPSGRPSR